MKARVERQIGASILSLEARRIGQAGRRQLSGAVRRHGGAGGRLPRAAPRPGDFFPLTCDYRVRVAAAGKFPGGFLKREGRPTTKEIPHRPADGPPHPAALARWVPRRGPSAGVRVGQRPAERRRRVRRLTGRRPCCRISPLPFQGPIASVRLGSIDGEFVPLPHARRLGGERPGPDCLWAARTRS